MILLTNKRKTVFFLHLVQVMVECYWNLSFGIDWELDMNLAAKLLIVYVMFRISLYSPGSKIYPAAQINAQEKNIFYSTFWNFSNIAIKVGFSMHLLRMSVHLSLSFWPPTVSSLTKCLIRLKHSTVIFTRDAILSQLLLYAYSILYISILKKKKC